VLAARFPVHVTMKALPTAPRLREGRCFRVICAAFAAAKDRFGFRLTQFTVQGNHVHLICEARDREALSRGMQGLAIRIARRVNRRTGRSGRLFAERYHARILRTPSEVRGALAYVLCNFRRHGHPGAGRDWIDELSSARYFDGWTRPIRRWAMDRPECPVVPPSAWLLREGWRKCGLIRPDEHPGP
jgi:REP element-mobilizing transposase RayT